MTNLGSFIFSFSLALWGSVTLLKLGQKWLLDLPSSRKIHKQPVPRTGGLALGAVYFLCLAIFGFSIDLWWYLIGALALFIMGAVDDYRSIRWYVKLSIELGVSSIVIFRFIEDVTTIGFFATSFHFSTFGLIAIFLIWFVGILNAVNLIDGMD